MEKFELYATITKWGEDDFSIEFIEAPKNVQNIVMGELEEHCTSSVRGTIDSLIEELYYVSERKKETDYDIYRRKEKEFIKEDIRERLSQQVDNSIEELSDDEFEGLVEKATEEFFRIKNKSKMYFDTHWKIIGAAISNVK